MRRSWISRSLASVFALWLAVCLAEPVQLHTCTMHDGLAIVQNAAISTHGHSSAAEHSAAPTEAEHFHQDQSSDGESRQCSCFGDCIVGSSPIGITAAGISLLTAAITESSGPALEYVSPRLVAPRFLRPFSNGPPAGSSRA